MLVDYFFLLILHPHSQSICCGVFLFWKREKIFETMKKKAYLEPCVSVEQADMIEILTGTVTNVGGNGGIGYGGGGSGPAHAPQAGDLCDEDDEMEDVEVNSMVNVSEHVRQSKLYKAWED